MLFISQLYIFISCFSNNIVHQKTIVMLTLNLTPIFKARSIQRPYSFLVKAGISHKTANTIINGTTRTFRLDHIELLCNLLICEPNDLLLWVPDKTKAYPPDHPLNKLKADPVDDTWLAAMPFKTLKEIIKKNTGEQ